MFELMKRPSRSASGAILYVTVGTLMVIWAGLWYFFFLYPNPNPPPLQRFVSVGTILSGFAIGAIGLLFGLIGRKAKSADSAVGVASSSPVKTPVVASGAGPAVEVPTPTTSVAPNAQSSTPPIRHN